MLLLGTLKLCFQVHKECHMHCGGNWWHQNTIPSEQQADSTGGNQFDVVQYQSKSFGNFD